MKNSANFLKTLVDIECVKFGDFTLKSGKQSPIYIDLRNIVSHPSTLTDLSYLFKDKISNSIQRICGVPYAALPIATVVSIQTGLPMIIKRKEVKKYGTKKIVEGEYNVGDKVLLIEDVITSGESLIETIKELESEGLLIEQIIVVLDREQGGVKRLIDKGYQVESLFSISSLVELLFKERKIDNVIYTNVLHFIQQNSIIDSPLKKPKKYLQKTHSNETAQRLLGIAHRKKSNLIASIDLITTKEIIELLNEIGNDICGAKLHIDIITDFTPSFIDELLIIAKRFDFLLIEDRKFADIGNTQLLQLSKGMYAISSWADMVTIHLIAGESALKAIQDWDSEKKPALIPVIEMSSSGALTDQDYIEKCKRFMYNYTDVIGAVCQTAELNTGFLKFTPGVNLESKNDDKGQNYNSPKYAIEQLYSDFLIIGRGIYSANDPKNEIGKYLLAIRELDFFGP